MEFDSPLTIVGMIATVLAMTFALAAFINSRRKQSQKTSKPAVNPDNAPPLPSVRQVIQQRLSGSQPTPAKAPDDSGKRPLSVFKQAGPQGAEVTPAAHYTDDEYIWE